MRTVEEARTRRTEKAGEKIAHLENGKRSDYAVERDNRWRGFVYASQIATTRFELAFIIRQELLPNELRVEGSCALKAPGSGSKDPHATTSPEALSRLDFHAHVHDWDEVLRCHLIEKRSRPVAISGTRDEVSVEECVRVHVQHRGQQTSDDGERVDPTHGIREHIDLGPSDVIRGRPDNTRQVRRLDVIGIDQDETADSEVRELYGGV